MRRALIAGLVCAAAGGMLIAFASLPPTAKHQAGNQSPSSNFENLTDAQFCEMTKKDAEDINREAPIAVDRVTRVEGMAVLCTFRSITFQKSVALNSSALKPGWRALYQRGHDQTACGNPLYLVMMRRGWRVIQRVTFANGEYAIFETTACPVG